MTQADAPLAGDVRTPMSDKGTAGKPSLLPLGLAIVAVASPAFFTVSFLAIVLGVAAAIAALVLAHRERRRGHRGAVLGWATALGALGAVADVVLVAVAIVIVAAPGPVEVTVEAYGDGLFTVTYGVGERMTTEEWLTDGWKKLGTRESSAVITVTPSTEPASGVEATHGCRILWAGEVVAEESSDSGEVTCSYEK
jgi:hypothetical protein